MTIQEVTEKLEKYSPFQFIGEKDKIVFKNNGYYINGTYHGNYEIIKGNNGINIHIKSLMPFQQNVKIDFGDNSEQIIINYNEQYLRLFPRETRHPSAKNGYFILKRVMI
jgi:hypothetical protein